MRNTQEAVIVGTLRIVPLPPRRAEVLDILETIQGPVLAQPGCAAGFEGSTLKYVTTRPR
jgi:hypothetical protein